MTGSMCAWGTGELQVGQAVCVHRAQEDGTGLGLLSISNHQQPPAFATG